MSPWKLSDLAQILNLCISFQTIDSSNFWGPARTKLYKNKSFKTLQIIYYCLAYDTRSGQGMYFLMITTTRHQQRLLLVENILYTKTLQLTIWSTFLLCGELKIICYCLAYDIQTGQGMYFLKVTTTRHQQRLLLVENILYTKTLKLTIWSTFLLCGEWLLQS